MRSFACWAVAAAAVALTSSSVLAAVAVSGNSARFGWAPSSGPVESYLVEVARNGGAFKTEKIVSGTRVTIPGAADEKLSIRVIALGSNGRRSAPSQISEMIKFIGSGGADKSGSSADKSRSNADKSRSSADKSRSSADKSGSNAVKSRSSADKSRSSADKSRSSADKSRSSADKSRSSAEDGSRQPLPPSAHPVQGATPHDFNGDGRTDLLWHNLETNAVAVWLMNGASSPGAAVLGTLDEKWGPVGSGDFDGDGYADLLLRNPLQGMSEIWLIDKGRVRGATSISGHGNNWTAEAIGDFDGDGYADVLWQKKGKSVVWFMRGSAVDEEVSAPEVEESSTVACAPELDGDGRSDLIWNGSGETAAWLMKGSSPWRSGRAGPTMGASLAVGCGDADGDGFGDVLWYHPASRRGTLWVMDGDVGRDRSFGLPPLRWGWAMEASGDFDGDGLANDILLRHAATGMLEVWKLHWNRARTGFSTVSTELTSRMPRFWQVVAR
jgi:hypothetical protein